MVFDADGSGIAKRWTWITPRAGWLVSDIRREGRIESGHGVVIRQRDGDQLGALGRAHHVRRRARAIRRRRVHVQVDETRRPDRPRHEM